MQLVVTAQPLSGLPRRRPAAEKTAIVRVPRLEELGRNDDVEADLLPPLRAVRGVLGQERRREDAVGNLLGGPRQVDLRRQPFTSGGGEYFDVNVGRRAWVG